MHKMVCQSFKKYRLSELFEERWSRVKESEKKKLYIFLGLTFPLCTYFLSDFPQMLSVYSTICSENGKQHCCFLASSLFLSEIPVAGMTSLCISEQCAMRYSVNKVMLNDNWAASQLTE